MVRLRVREAGGTALEVVVKVDEEGQAGPTPGSGLVQGDLLLLVRALRVEAAAWPRAVDVRPVDGAAGIRVAEAAEVAIEACQPVPGHGGGQVRLAAREERTQHLVRGWLRGWA